jgi:hypothetical protein
MYNEYIRNIRNRKMDEKQTVCYLMSLKNRAHNERRIAQCDLANAPILTDSEIAELEDMVKFYTDRIIEVRKTAKFLGVYSEAFER